MSQAQAYKPSHGGYPGNVEAGALRKPVPNSWERRRNAAIANGLQAHSIGDIYPYCVVGLGIDESARWELHDLGNGTRAICDGDHALSAQRGKPRQWANGRGGFSMAYDFAVKVIEGSQRTNWA